MFLIQQSSSFRVWTSRALMVYFRRALLFLVVSPRQNLTHKHISLEQQQQQKVCFSDAEDDEEVLMMNDEREFTESLFHRTEDNANQIQINQSKYHLLKEYVYKEFSQGLNNSMSKLIDKDTPNFLVEKSTDKSSIIFDSVNLNQESKIFSIKSINNIETNKNKLSDNSSVNQYPIKTSYSLWQQTPSHFNSTNPVPSSPSCPVCHSLSTMSHSEYLSPSSDDEDDIYEKYQTSFSHVLHQTKSLHTIRQEDKLHSMLVLEPNTSIITVRPLIYHSCNSNTINYSMFTNRICVRLIANPIDSSIQCDTKPIGCKKRSLNNIIKSTSINNQQQQNFNQNKKLQATSILIDLPYKTLYIDT